MNSPPSSPANLRGASHVVGGFARGCALGNIFNIADANDVAIHDLGPAMGKVYLYFCNTDPGQFNLASVKPTGTVKCAISPTVGPVLKTVARKFSPVRDNKRRIYTLEDDSWSLKGRFNIAEEEDEDISWTKTESGEYVAHLLAVSHTLKY
ncbi:hypothetical protein BYT27DRAFT_7082360 [Phlegmacium glaucopus]|nr:hypothetical protein BYT27DRAFT_7082360 [Phlegmacium glaucopus]